MPVCGGFATRGPFAAVTLALAGGVAVAPAPAETFTGHRCTLSTCRYFTSDYRTTKYYYDRGTCSQWKSLSRTHRTDFAPRPRS